MRHPALSVVLLASLAACTDKSDADFRADVSVAAHTSIIEDLEGLAQAARRLQRVSPTRAWEPFKDRDTIREMQEAWKNARIAWEHVEGAIAPMFPGYNASMDSRYEDFLPGPDSTGDRNLFDGTGVVGMHAIERILFAGDIRPEIVRFEKDLTGYMPAAYPTNDGEAIAFKTQLVQRLIDDTNGVITELQETRVELATAYGGLVSLMAEQREKLKAATQNEEESRYANITLFDLRNNLDGTKKVYVLFRDWILAKSAATSDRRILDRLDTLMEAYYTTNSDSLPEIPQGWSSDDPTPDSLNTPFGALWMEIHRAVDPATDGSVVFEMNRIARVLGFPAFVGD
jgi:iron uptake system component EfeO